MPSDLRPFSSHSPLTRPQRLAGFGLRGGRANNHSPLHMQLPKRKLGFQTEHPDAVVYLKPEGVKKIEREIKRLKEVDEPRAIVDVSAAVQKGDLSENAEYQESRGRLTRIQNRIVKQTERLKRVEVISSDGVEVVNVGSSVTIESEEGKRKTYEVVGPDEVDPAHGRISYLSPIGSVLMKHAVGDGIVLTIGEKQTTYTIKEIE
jgi:transcription elongation GreA/GreB family factor